jgi:hypothetical protein
MAKREQEITNRVETEITKKIMVDILRKLEAQFAVWFKMMFNSRNVMAPPAS